MEYAIVMELCNCNLDDMLKESYSNLKDYHIKNILKQLNNSFRLMLKNKIIHRDIKLQNILIKYNNNNKTDYSVKLTDYGISKQLYTLSQQNNTFCGTPYTMAPEIIKKEQYDNKCDLWSIGVVIYYLCFNEYPYQYADLFGNINHLDQNKFKKHCNQQLNDLISKLLRVDPKKRISWDEYFNHPFFK